MTAVTNAPLHATPSSRGDAFALYVAVVLTIVMVLFPPYTSINGTEYAFVLTGPEWTRLSGLTPRLHWAALLVQLGTVWAIALGARWFFSRGSAGPPLSVLALELLWALFCPSFPSPSTF